MKIKCPNCHASYSVPETVRGQMLDCGRCQTSFVVPVKVAKKKSGCFRLVFLLLVLAAAAWGLYFRMTGRVLPAVLQDVRGPILNHKFTVDGVTISFYDDFTICRAKDRDGTPFTGEVKCVEPASGMFQGMFRELCFNNGNADGDMKHYQIGVDDNSSGVCHYSNGKLQTINGVLEYQYGNNDRIAKVYRIKEQDDGSQTKELFQEWIYNPAGVLQEVKWGDGRYMKYSWQKPVEYFVPGRFKTRYNYADDGSIRCDIDIDAGYKEKFLESPEIGVGPAIRKGEVNCFANDIPLCNIIFDNYLLRRVDYFDADGNPCGRKEYVFDKYHRCIGIKKSSADGKDTGLKISSFGNTGVPGVWNRQTAGQSYNPVRVTYDFEYDKFGNISKISSITDTGSLWGMTFKYGKNNMPIEIREFTLPDKTQDSGKNRNRKLFYNIDSLQNCFKVKSVNYSETMMQIHFFADDGQLFRQSDAEGQQMTSSRLEFPVEKSAVRNLIAQIDKHDSGATGLSPYLKWYNPSKMELHYDETVGLTCSYKTTGIPFDGVLLLETVPHPPLYRTLHYMTFAQGRAYGQWKSVNPAFVSISEDDKEKSEMLFSDLPVYFFNGKVHTSTGRSAGGEFDGEGNAE